MRTGMLLVAGLLVASPVGGQTPVPPRVQIIAETLHARHPVLAMGGDDQRRELTRKIVEQVVFEFPGDGWGWKSADPTRPPSKDAIARQTPELLACDWQNGATRQPNRPVMCHPAPGQHFLPLAGVNHLGSSPPHDPPPTVPPPPNVDAVLTLLRQARAEDHDQQETIYVDLKASIADSVAQVTNEVRAAHSALREQLRLMDENPSWVKKILSNRFVQIASAAVGTWLTTKLMTAEPKP